MIKPEDYILAALKVDTPHGWLKDNYPVFSRETLYRVATRNMVEPMVAHRLMELPGLGERERAFWDSVRQVHQYRATTILNTVRHLAARLRTEDVPLILLKDTGLAMEAYRCPYCRKAEDVDLLVPEGSFEIIERIMEEEGFSLNLTDYYHRPRSYLVEVNGQMEFDREVPVPPGSVPADPLGSLEEGTGGRPTWGGAAEEGGGRSEGEEGEGESKGERESDGGGEGEGLARADNGEADHDGEVEYETYQHQAVEFHVRPQAGTWIRRTQEGSAADLFSRANWYSTGPATHRFPRDPNSTEGAHRPLVRKRVPCWSKEPETGEEDRVIVGVLAPHDNLVHVAVHAAKHCFVLDRAIRMYVDMDRLIRNTGPDWDLFLQMAGQHRMKQAISIALSITQELLNTPIPPRVFKELGRYKRAQWIIKPLIGRKGIWELEEGGGSKLSGFERRLIYLLLNDTMADSMAAVLGAAFPSREALQLRYDRLSFLSGQKSKGDSSRRKRRGVTVFTAIGHASRVVFGRKL